MRPQRAARRNQVPPAGVADDVVRDTLVARLADDGHRWPEVGAALVVARGRLRLDRDGMASRLGCRAELVEGLEAGTRHPGDAPVTILQVDPDTDWVALVLTAFGPGRSCAPRAPRPGTLANDLVRRRILAVAPAGTGDRVANPLPGFEHLA